MTLEESENHKNGGEFLVEMPVNLLTFGTRLQLISQSKISICLALLLLLEAKYYPINVHLAPTPVRISEANKIYYELRFCLTKKSVK